MTMIILIIIHFNHNKMMLLHAIQWIVWIIMNINNKINVSNNKLSIIIIAISAIHLEWIITTITIKIWWIISTITTHLVLQQTLNAHFIPQIKVFLPLHALPMLYTKKYWLIRSQIRSVDIFINMHILPSFHTKYAPDLLCVAIHINPWVYHAL